MKPNSLLQLTSSMTPTDWSALRGAVCCALYNVGDAPDTDLDRHELTEVLRRLPESFSGPALRAGLTDSEVGSAVVSFIETRLQELGSFEAFIKSEQEQR